MRPHMPQTRSTLRTLGWLYTAGFLGIFLICHTPGFTDADGKLFGLFRIDPIDDFVHLLSGIAGALISWRGTRYLPAYFIVIGILYDLDAVVGMTMSRGLLDLSVFKSRPGLARLRADQLAAQPAAYRARHARAHHRHRPAR